MKPKNIERHLRQKVDDWLESIEDEKVRALAAQGTICMGGAIASLLQNEKINDYDLYFKDKETCKAVAEYYVQKFLENPPSEFRDGGHDVEIAVVDDSGGMDDSGRIKIVVKSAGVAGEGGDAADYAYFEGDPDPTDQEAFLSAALGALEEKEGEEGKPYRPIFLSANAVTLSDKIQLVIRFYGKPADVRASYDFVHVTNYWTSWGASNRDRLYLRKDALIALMTKELQVINGGTQYPFAAICRIRKFTKRGFHITAGHVLKLCLAISELDFRDYEVLEEQLTGVDLAYFQELLSYLDAHREDWVGEDNKLKTPYLLDLIDRLL